MDLEHFSLAGFRSVPIPFQNPTTSSSSTRILRRRTPMAYSSSPESVACFPFENKRSKEKKCLVFPSHSCGGVSGERFRRKLHKEYHCNPETPLDPITFGEIGDPQKQFNFSRSNGTVVTYNIATLIEYILKTGHFYEPETRIEFSDDDLKRMDDQARLTGLQTDSVLKARYNMAKFAQEKFKREALEGLERLAGEQVSEMLSIIENCDDQEDGEMRLAIEIFPQFADLMQQIKEHDLEQMKQTLDHFKSFLEGPPNKPTPDPFGFKKNIIEFLDTV